MNRGTWIIEKAKNGEYYFNYLASNGQILCTSETYTQKHNVVSAISTICKDISNHNVIKVIDNTLKTNEE